MMSEEHIEMTKEQQSVLTRSSDFHGNCSRGFRRGWNTPIHHVLPCTTLNMRKNDYPPGKTDYLERCLWVTKWDINAGNNLVGLPLKNQYRYSGGKVPTNLPCHDVDHPKYNGEVRDWLKKNIWNALNYKQKIHKVDVETILDQLKAGEKDHLGLLRIYGRRSKGTRYSWANRLDADHSKVWYEPFSMSKLPEKRNPPSARGAMATMFKKCF